MRKLLMMVMAGAVLATPGAAGAQESGIALSVRGGVNVPTFGISDVAETGPGFGFGLQFPLGETLFARANADFGMHDIVGSTAEVDVQHFIAGVGFPVVMPSDDSRWLVSVNAGAGAMRFSPDGGESNTYFAINVGGEIEYLVSDRVSLLLSPQGDIGFVDEDLFGTSTAWIWPFTAGAKIRF